MHVLPKTPKHKRVLTRVGVVTIGLLLVLQVVVSNQLATKGLEIAEIEGQISDLKEQNTQISGEIASASALLRVQDQAHALGFTDKVRPVFFHKDQVAVDLHK